MLLAPGMGSEGRGILPGSGGRVGRPGSLGIQKPATRAAPIPIQPLLCDVERNVSRGTCRKVTNTCEDHVTQWLERGEGVGL